MNGPNTAPPGPRADGVADTVEVDVELAQSLELLEAVAIGVGTMIGAGIFVLPGSILGEVGPAAIASFFQGNGLRPTEERGEPRANLATGS